MKVPYKGGIYCVQRNMLALISACVLLLLPAGGDARTITFAGREWNVRSAAGGPGPNNWSDDSASVWVDGSGQLHLKIRKVGGIWYCAEVESVVPTHYGIHRFYLSSRIDQLDRNVVFSPFLYKDDLHEIDVEFSKWGSWLPLFNTQFVVQPGSTQGNCHRFSTSLSGNNSTHYINWQSSSIRFKSFHGHYSEPPSWLYLIQDWTYTGANNPSDSLGLKIIINLWLYQGSPPSNDQEVEVIVTNANLPDTILPAELDAFSVDNVVGSGTFLRWQTASETRNAGWNVWRKDRVGDWLKINNALIPGAGTAPFGKQYVLDDNEVSPNAQYVYRLESLSLDGKSEFSSEVTVGGRIGDNSVPLAETSTNTQANLTAANAAPIARTLPTDPADYLIVAPSCLLQAAQPLVNFRRAQGYRVNVVAAENIYAADSAQRHDENAIRDFLVHTYGMGKGKLRYVLLLGDAAVFPDGKQVYGNGMLPTCVRNAEGIGMIPTDYPYACVAGDDEVPELVVGRIPSRSPAEMEGICRKIIRNEQGPSSCNVAFVNGLLVQGEEFAETSAETIISEFCQGLDVERIYLMPFGSDLQQYQGGAQDLDVLLTHGCAWLEFRGHGAGSMWAGLKDSNGARTGRTSGQIPVVISVSCYEGAFADCKDRISLGEAFVRNPEGGAVAYVGNSGGGYVYA